LFGGIDEILIADVTSMTTPEELMKLAIAKAREGVAMGQSPFGCAIARGDELIAVAHNTVLTTTDITAHAEMNAIRQACQSLRQIHLTDCVVATTCEPCPMCMAALHWARVDQVYFGASIADADVAGFNELKFPAADLLRSGGSKVKLVPGILTADCRQLFADWSKSPLKRTY
jgi:tRNA(Arg) A34 adenosine deaminase TadA